MTIYTWNKGRSGTSTSAATDTVIANLLHVYAPGTATTVRRSIVDWGIDLIATDKDGSINSKCPVTVALIGIQSETATPTAPNYGPDDNANLGWWWWGGAWFGNGYGVTTAGETNGIFTVNGRIDLRVQHDLIDSLYTGMWLVSEIKDVDSGWSTFNQIAWSQFLSAPTVG